MSLSQENETDIALEAAHWVVRAQADTFDDTDIISLTAWLEADVAHARAFEAALLAWDQAESLRETAPVQDLASEEVVSLSDFRHRVTARKASIWRSPGLLAGMAAALAAAILLPVFALKGAPVRVYETHKGQRQTVALDDGSSLELNTDTRIRVRLSDRARKLVLDRGEVALKVTHAPSRPLTLTAGDAKITDLGTEFNVRRDGDGTVAVAVREGEVRIADTQASEGGAAAATLHRGDVAVHQAGIAGAMVSHGDPDQAFAWQSAHAIYEDQPLSMVVKDLNRYFDKPIVVDDQAGKLRLSAILTLDSEPLVVRRLQDFLPVQAKTTDSGIYLSVGAHRGGN
jgi:transmembrane sensor